MPDMWWACLRAQFKPRWIVNSPTRFWHSLGERLTFDHWWQRPNSRSAHSPAKKEIINWRNARFPAAGQDSFRKNVERKLQCSKCWRRRGLHNLLRKQNLLSRLAQRHFRFQNLRTPVLLGMCQRELSDVDWKRRSVKIELHAKWLRQPRYRWVDQAAF